MIKQLIDSELEIAFFGLIIVGVLELCALLKGLDGQMFGFAIAGIGAIIGWVAKMYQQKVKKNK
jgi:hypothetical protein